MEQESQIVSQSDPVATSAPAQPASSNLALILTIIALLFWFGFQTVQLIRERANLGAVKSNQDGAIQEAEKIRMQFESLITKTTELASQGQVGAKVALQELQKLGLSFKAETQPAK